MTIDTALSGRQRMLLSLADDLAVHGWDQKPKLWWVKGTPDDEWLVYSGEIPREPENYLLDLIAGQELPDDAHGLLIASEGWSYPADDKPQWADQDEMRASWKSNPPSAHPRRQENRQLLLACSDGDVLALMITRDEDAMQWTSIDVSVACPVGDRTVDAARALLGLNEPLVSRLRQVDGMQAIARMATILDQAQTGQIDERDLTRELFLSLPDAVKPHVIATMPPEVREEVRNALSEEERRKYGL